jgi:hypothetical protein
MRGQNGAAGNAHNFQARERKHAGNISAACGKNRTVGITVFTASTHFAFEQNKHAVGRHTFANNDIPHGSMVFFALGDKPEQIVRRKVCEHLYGEQLSYEFFG